MFNPRLTTSQRNPACAGLLGVVLMTAFLANCSSSTSKARDPSKGITVAVSRVKRATLSRDLVLAAEFRPYQEVDMDAKVAGYVKSISVDIGDRVSAGQLLAVLEIPELRHEVNQAEGMVRQSQQEIQHSQYELNQAEASYRATHLQYTRLAQVTKSQPNLIAQQEIDDASSKDQAAAAQVDAAKAALAASKERLEVAKANEARVRAMYSYARITAPFTGIITKRYADTGAMVQAGTASHTQAMPVVRLSQVNLLRLTIPVPESAVPLVHAGMDVQVDVPSLRKTYLGKVARFSDQLDFSTRTMRTEIDVANPKGEVVPGMYAYATLVLERSENVLTVPVQALDRQGSLVTVLRVTPDHKLERATIQLGVEAPERVEVVSGLSENDQVVVSARSQLRQGETVRPNQADLRTPEGDR